MASKILIVSNTSTFITDSLKNNLLDAGFDTVNITGTRSKDYNKQVDAADYFLIYASDEIISEKKSLYKIQNICQMDPHKAAFMVGYPEELEALSKVILPESVAYSFVRPFDMKELTTSFVEFEVKMERLKRKNSTSDKQWSILLCDDDMMFLKMMRDWLSEYYRINIVKSGMQVISFITNNRPDLILLDYDMPVVTGTKVLEMIRSDPECEDIPVIFLTGKADRDTVVEVLKMKPQGYMLKSLKRKDILAQLEHFFRTKKWDNIEL